MKSKTFEYPILDTWDEIPVVFDLDEGIILDGGINARKNIITINSHTLTI